MKLCIDARLLGPGGIGTYLKEMITRLPPWDITLLVNADLYTRFPWLSHYNCRVMTSPIYGVQEQGELSFKIPSCDLFWSPHYNIPLLGIRAKKRVVTIHDVAHLARADTLSWQERCYARFVLKQAVKRSDLVITVSCFSQQEIVNYLGAEKERILPIAQGINHDLFHPVSCKNTETTLRTKYGLPQHFLLWVGNVKPHKNMTLISEAYHRFPITLPLVIVGRSEQLRNPDPLLHRLRSDGRFHYVAEVPDEEVPHFYRMAKALVFPSLYEGFGLPPLEAMACGCPVIAAHTSSLPEVCDHAAEWIDPYCPDTLYHAIENLTKDPDATAKRRARGLERATRFSWHKTTQQYTALFAQLLVSKE